MTLMVVLVPFLLSTAVFSRLSVLTIDVPTPSSKDTELTPPPPMPDKPPFRLSLRLEKDAVVVVAGTLVSEPIAREKDGSYNTAIIHRALAQVKKAHPDHNAIDILSRPDTPYADLVEVMDADSSPIDGSLLFPDIRLGEFTP
jgi:biopolymer transport protein ExbD